MNDADYEDYAVILEDTPPQVVFQLQSLEQALERIGLIMCANKIEYMF